MKAMFVNEDSFPYAHKIALGEKMIETRSRDMLSALVGERIAIVATHSRCRPMVIGYVDVVSKAFLAGDELEKFRCKTLIPRGSKYDTPARWCYFLMNTEHCNPYPLPASAVRHGRSWCEF